MQRWRGTLIRMVMMAVAAVLIGGHLAAPADAKQRPAAANANAFVTLCFDAGGDVSVDADGDVIRAICTLPGNVGSYYCRFEGVSVDCEIIPKGIAADDSTVFVPGDLLALGTEPEEPAPERSLAVTAAADTQDDEQGLEPKPKKKQAKKAKQGKGKAKQRGKGRGGR